MTYLNCASATKSPHSPRPRFSVRDGARTEYRAESPDTLYTEFAPILAAIIHRLSDDVETRRDLTGEAYIAFRMFLQRYDPERGVPLRPYVISQVKAHLYSRCRSRRGVHRREIPLGVGDLRDLAASDPTPAWDREMELRQMASALPEMLKVVPERQRRVLVWRYFDEMSFDEIAGRLGVQPATARSLLRHGMRRLRELARERLDVPRS